MAPGTSEDCLYLNIWAPPLSYPSPFSQKPVIAWIHGGDGVYGTATNDITDGSLLANQGDVVVVSIAYRLGPFGMMATPYLSADSPKGASGNQNYRDIIMALQWIRWNIESFGGDHRKVTLMGHRAGALVATALMASPLTHKLFGSVILLSPRDFKLQSVSLQEAHEDAQQCESNLGCYGNASTICMEGKSTEEVLASCGGGAAYVRSTLEVAGKEKLHPLSPVLDDDVFTKAAAKSMKRGFSTDKGSVPMIVGSSSEDLELFISLDRLNVTAAAQDTVQHLRGSINAKKAMFNYAIEYYKKLDGDSGQGPAKPFATDLLVTYSVWLQARRMVLRYGEGATVYRYLLAPNPAYSKSPAAQHQGDSVALLFGDLPLQHDNIPAIALGKYMRQVWGAFAADPRGPWKKFGWQKIRPSGPQHYVLLGAPHTSRRRVNRRPAVSMAVNKAQDTLMCLIKAANTAPSTSESNQGSFSFPEGWTEPEGWSKLRSVSTHRKGKLLPKTTLNMTKAQRNSKVKNLHPAAAVKESLLKKERSIASKNDSKPRQSRQVRHGGAKDSGGDAKGYRGDMQQARGADNEHRDEAHDEYSNNQHLANPKAGAVQVLQRIQAKVARALQVSHVAVNTVRADIRHMIRRLACLTKQVTALKGELGWRTGSQDFQTHLLDVLRRKQYTIHKLRSRIARRTLQEVNLRSNVDHAVAHLRQQEQVAEPGSREVPSDVSPQHQVNRNTTMNMTRLNNHGKQFQSVEQKLHTRWKSKYEKMMKEEAKVRLHGRSELHEKQKNITELAENEHAYKAAHVLGFERAAKKSKKAQNAKLAAQRTGTARDANTAESESTSSQRHVENIEKRYASSANSERATKAKSIESSELRVKVAQKEVDAVSKDYKIACPPGSNGYLCG